MGCSTWLPRSLSCSFLAACGYKSGTLFRLCCLNPGADLTLPLFKMGKLQVTLLGTGSGPLSAKRTEEESCSVKAEIMHGLCRLDTWVLIPSSATDLLGALGQVSFPLLPGGIGSRRQKENVLQCGKQRERNLLPTTGTAREDGSLTARGGRGLAC